MTTSLPLPPGSPASVTAALALLKLAVVKHVTAALALHARLPAATVTAGQSSPSLCILPGLLWGSGPLNTSLCNRDGGQVMLVQHTGKSFLTCHF